MKYLVAYTTTNTNEVKFATAFGKSDKGAMMPIRRKEGKGVVAQYAAINSQYIKNSIKSAGFEVADFTGKTRAQVVEALRNAGVIALKAEILANYVIENCPAPAPVVAEVAPVAAEDQPVAVETVATETVVAQPVAAETVVLNTLVEVAQKIRNRGIYVVTATHRNSGKNVVGFCTAKSDAAAIQGVATKFSFGSHASIIDSAQALTSADAIQVIFDVLRAYVGNRRNVSKSELADILDNCAPYSVNEFFCGHDAAEILADGFNKMP